MATERSTNSKPHSLEKNKGHSQKQYNPRAQKNSFNNLGRGNFAAPSTKENKSAAALPLNLLTGLNSLNLNGTLNTNLLGGLPLTLPFNPNLFSPSTTASSFSPQLAAPLLPVLDARKIIKVSAKSNVKSVAGAIAHTTRAGDPPTLMATGVESINQAVKAIAIARGYLLENKLDIICQPIFRSQEKSAMTFALTKSVPPKCDRTKSKSDDENQSQGESDKEKNQELRVARGSEASSVAGSIANKIRAGERVIIQSIGPGSVATTVRAIALARRYLEQNGLDISFRPEFIHIKLDDGDRSALKFSLLSQQV